jgi:hypothetical protein
MDTEKNILIDVENLTDVCRIGPIDRSVIALHK